MKKLYTLILSTLLLGSIASADSPNSPPVYRPAWKDINIGGMTLNLPVANQPGEAQITDGTGTGTGIYTFGFAIGEGGSASIELQHDYKEGTDVYFHIHWQGIAAVAGGTDNVKWQIVYTIVDEDGDETVPAATTITKESAYTTRYAVVTSSFAAITGTDLRIGDQIVFKLSRISASADDYAGEALVTTLGLHYQCDGVGSVTQTTKR